MKWWFGRGDKLSGYEQRLLANIENFGWHDTFVYGRDDDGPNFSYSIGFTSTLEAPEFITFGLDQPLMHAMLWETFRQIQAGKQVTDGSAWSNVIEGFDCVAKPVHPDNIVRDYLNSAIWYWRRKGHEGLPPVYQLVWPGASDGLYPWDEGCADIVMQLQPPLWLPAAGHA